MFADVCIRSPKVCRRLHTFTPCLQTSAYFWPMDPRLCIMLALGSMIVHRFPAPVDRSMERQPGPLGSKVVRSSPGPQGIASCWPPWDPSRELHRVPARSSNHARPPWNRLRELHRVPALGSMVVHHAGPHGIHRGNCIEYRPAGDCCCWPGRC